MLYVVVNGVFEDLHTFLRGLRRAPHLVDQRAIRQRLGQMDAADFFGAIEIRQGARDTQNAMIAARRKPHGVGGLAQ